MKILGRVLIGLLSVVGFLAICLYLLSVFENPSSRFETYQHLAASGLMERGWIPEGLPKSARHIVESHDISANTGRASFSYEPADVTTTRQGCKVLVETERGATFLCPPFDGQAFLVKLGRDGEGSWTLVGSP